MSTSFLSADARSSNSNAYEVQQTCIVPPPLPVESNFPKVSRKNTSFLSANAESTSCDPYVVRSEGGWGGGGIRCFYYRVFHFACVDIKP